MDMINSPHCVETRKDMAWTGEYEKHTRVHRLQLQALTCFNGGILTVNRKAPQ